MITHNKKIGNCEATHMNGDGEDVEIFLDSHNMWLCAACAANERRIEKEREENKSRTLRIQHADTPIERVTDLFNADTKAMTEKRAEIFADPTIPDDRKEYAFSRYCEAQVDKFDKLLFDTRAQLKEFDNQRSFWIVNTQHSIGKLEAKLQGEFKAMQVSYVPTEKKDKKADKPKETTPGKPRGKKFDLAEVKAAAARYGVDASMVQMAMTQKIFKTVEEAAAALAKAK